MFLVPTFTGPENLPGWWKGNLPSDPVHLGLDLRGGIHMVLEVEVDRAVQAFEAPVARLIARDGERL